MKKVITILAIMIVAACAVFAANGDNLNLVSAVGKLPPVIKIRAVDAAKTPATIVGAATAQDVVTGRDIAEQDIEWVFTIYQDGNIADTEKAYARYNQTVTITLTLGHFIGTSEKPATANDNPVVTEIAPGTPDTKNKLALDKTGTTSLNATYSGKVTNQDLGTFTCKWTKDETLPDDTYKALVTLNYTVQ